MGLRQDKITLVSFSGLAASGNSAAFDLSGYNSGVLYIVATAVSGTSPTLAVQLATTWDGTNYINVPTQYIGSITGPTAVGTVASAFLIPFALGTCRFAYTVGGTTPSYTGVIGAILNKF